jgi:hypothetical protein
MRYLYIYYSNPIFYRQKIRLTNSILFDILVLDGTLTNISNSYTINVLE